MIEVLKILAPLLGGGLAGVLLNEWLRRKRSGVQRIPLIERVNRLVNPELQGFALARVITGSSGRKLEEINNLREYQLTMRNSSSTHLQDAEVQFEFPADDVQAWASRPVLSKTALVQVNAVATEPWKMAFRWRIPNLPSGDSVEFTFQAVDPSSEKFEAALYHPDGVVLEKIEGEPRAEKNPPSAYFNWTIAVIFGAILLLSVVLVISQRQASGAKIAMLSVAGCELRVISASAPYDEQAVQWWKGPFEIRYRVLNYGAQDCVIQSKEMMIVRPFIIKAGEALEKEALSKGRPEILDVEISVGITDASTTRTSVPAYVGR
jgi:hypothetical protein